MYLFLSSLVLNDSTVAYSQLNQTLTRTQHKLHQNKTHENAYFLAVLTILKTQRLQAEKQFILERQA